MKCFIETLGCPKNVADSESAAGILERAGHVIVKDPNEADVLLVNTCGFINDAKEESIDRIFDMAQWKGEGRLLAVSGCLSQRYGKQLRKSMPEVDLFLGVNEYDQLPKLLEEFDQRDQRKTEPVLVQAPPCREYQELGPKKSLGEEPFAYLKIAEGCDNICAYCVIPSIRGPYRSRRPEEVVNEAKELVKSGIKEIILVAQDVTAYGTDLEGGESLAKLLHQLCQIKELPWIRLMYCYEDRITEELIQVIRDNPKICRYLDIPIQHASDAVLSAMNRRSSQESIRRTVETLRRQIPDLHIRTTLITGFPGETEEDFAALRAFVQEMKFERLGVFAYSREEGTPAAAMKGQVRKQAKEKRRDALMALQREISLAHNEAQVGKVLEVLVEEREEGGSFLGRSRYDAPEIDNSVIFTSRRNLLPGELTKVRITDAYDYDLVGEEEEEDEDEGEA